MNKVIANSVLAGLLISIGGSIYLASSSKYVGAVLFSVALLCICIKGYNLYTGKIGYLVEDRSKDNVNKTLLCLIVNLVTVYVVGMAVGIIMSEFSTTAFNICTLKLEQPIYETLLRGTFCGMLMYLAVSIYKMGRTIGIIYCIPVFILSGWEHSIADMFYFGASGIQDANIIKFMIAVIIGNTIGSMFIAALERVK